jgi:hypothetical protein
MFKAGAATEAGQLGEGRGLVIETPAVFQIAAGLGTSVAAGPMVFGFIGLPLRLPEYSGGRGKLRRLGVYSEDGLRGSG